LENIRPASEREDLPYNNCLQLNRYQIFVDFKHVYDNINHEKLYKIMYDTGTPCKLITLVRATRTVGLNKE
jgi:hypothetical protein